MASNRVEYVFMKLGRSANLEKGEQGTLQERDRNIGKGAFPLSLSLSVPSTTDSWGNLAITSQHDPKIIVRVASSEGIVSSLAPMSDTRAEKFRKSLLLVDPTVTNRNHLRSGRPSAGLRLLTKKFKDIGSTFAFFLIKLCMMLLSPRCFKQRLSMMLIGIPKATWG